MRDGYSLADLKAKIDARTAALDSALFPHRKVTAKGDYDTLRGEYKADPSEQAAMEKSLEDVKRRKHGTWTSKDWQKYNKFATFRDERERFLPAVQEIERAHVAGTSGGGVMSIDRFDFRDVTYEWFVRNYERPSLPCMISGFADDWDMNRFTYASMAEGPWKGCRVKVGKDDEGYPIRIPIRQYVHYASQNKDDSPVYLFESQVAADKVISTMLKTYARPEWFRNDFFDHCNANRRPPHRWLCVGPERSGTTMHTDPLNTNAWNTVIAGRKLWIVFPPGTPEDVAKGTRFFSKTGYKPNLEHEGIGWYLNVYPKLKEWILSEGNKYGMQELIQYPGETIFVPGSWWHFVVNLDDTLAVTMNYVSMSNLPMVWRDVRVERKHMAKRWLGELEVRQPQAFALAMELNKQDGFKFKFRQPSAASRRPFRCQLNGGKAVPAMANPTELPFAYDGWSDASGGADSSTDSSDNSDDDDDDGGARRPLIEVDLEEEAKKILIDRGVDLTGLSSFSSPSSSSAAAAAGSSVEHKIDREPAFATLVGDWAPGDSTEALRQVDEIKRKKNPQWSLPSWRKYRYSDAFPRLRDSLSAWADFVERVAPAAARANAPPAISRRAPTAAALDEAALALLLPSAEDMPRVSAEKVFRSQLSAWLAAGPAELKGDTGDASTAPSSASSSSSSSSSSAAAAAAAPSASAGLPSGMKLVLPLPRVRYTDLSYEAFQAQYERPLLPVLISGMTEGWPMNGYTADSLSTGKYRNVRFKVAKDTKGYRQTMKMRHFMQYIANSRDDAPLYLFESQLEIIDVATEMQQDYTRPQFFTRDLFDLVNFNRRPPQRWLCVGAQNSGSQMHKDPLNTNAWNALVHGRKYWLLMAPEVPEEIADGSYFTSRYPHLARDANQSQSPPTPIDSTVGWFTRVLPYLRQYVVSKFGKHALYEVIQYPGETIFVPGNWHHAVLNLDDTLAITQNYCNESNFEAVWSEARVRRKHMATRWLAALDQHHPEIARLAHEMNKRDGFTFNFSDTSRSKKVERSKRRAAWKARKLREAEAAAKGLPAPAADSDVDSDEDSDDLKETSGEWDSSTNSD